jgi:hypothetical protein
MEARATFNGSTVPKTFIAGAFVLVAMGLAAMSGYMAHDALKGGVTGASANTTVHAAAGTVLRQDNPAQAAAVLPGWMEQEIAARAGGNRIIVDDPNFYKQYLNSSPAVERQPDHGILP